MSRKIYEEKIETLIEICKRKRKLEKGKLKTFETQSLFSYGYSVDLPFYFELYQKSFQVLKTRVMPTAIYHTMRDVGNAQQTMCKRREMERKKTIAVIRLPSDELEKFWQGLGGFHLDPRFV